MTIGKIGTGTFLIALALVLLTEMAANLAVLSEMASPAMIMGVIRVLQIIFLLQIVASREHGLGSAGLATDQIGPGLTRGLIWSLAFGLVVGIVSAILFFAGINPLKLLRVPLPKSVLDIIPFILLRGLIGPVAEEIFFRGILYGFLRRWGIFPALFLSTLAFVCAHPAVGLIQMTGGLLFAVAYEGEKKLMVPILIHVIGNMSIFAVSALS